jgi:rhamnose utilization protein RhaD (predicted bifunctional aldolase and dehydrogenase)
MHSLWSKEAERLIDHYGAAGIGRDLALRVYSSRLLGGEPNLVLHGGGNTSVKTIFKDLLGEEVEAPASRAAAGRLLWTAPVFFSGVRIGYSPEPADLKQNRTGIVLWRWTTPPLHPQ